MIRKLRIAYFNCNGVAGKKESIKQFFRREKLDILILAETWLKTGDSCGLRGAIADLRTVRDYNALGGRRGVDGILVLTSRKVRNMVRIMETDTEKKWCIMRIGDVWVGTGYFSPSTATEKIRELVDKTLRSGEKCVLLADFNTTMAGNLDERGRLLSEYDLVHLELTGKWTTVTARGRGVADHIFVSPSLASRVIHSRVLTNESCGGSDHRPIQMDLIMGQLPAPKEFERWNIKKLRDVVQKRAFAEALTGALQDKFDANRRPQAILNPIRPGSNAATTSNGVAIGFGTPTHHNAGSSSVGGGRTEEQRRILSGAGPTLEFPNTHAQDLQRQESVRAMDGNQSDRIEGGTGEVVGGARPSFEMRPGSDEATTSNGFAVGFGTLTHHNAGPCSVGGGRTEEQRRILSGAGPTLEFPNAQAQRPAGHEYDPQEHANQREILTDAAAAGVEDAEPVPNLDHGAGHADLMEMHADRLEEELNHLLQTKLQEQQGVETQGDDQVWTFPARKARVELAAEILFAAVIEAATLTVGKLGYNSEHKNDFFTDELRVQKERLEARQERLMDDGLDRAGYQEEWAHLQEDKATFREGVAKRRTELFQDAADELSSPAMRTTLQKLLRNTKARDRSTRCMLDPDRMTEHMETYRRSFGKRPGGEEAEINRESLLQTSHRMINRKNATAPVSRADVRSELQWLTRGKASGPDGLFGEMLQAGGETMAIAMTWLINICLENSLVPCTWQQALVCPIFKKGDITNCDNYRPIALTCIMRRVYERLIEHRLRPAYSRLSPMQGGFRPQRSTYDSVAFLHEAIVGNDLKLIFLDIQAAYDTVDRRILWSRLADTYMIPHDLIAILRSLFDENRSRLVIQGHKSEEMRNRSGLFQGSSLSPMLFNFFIDGWMRAMSNLEDKVLIHGVRCNLALYADDAVLLAYTEAALARLLAASVAWADRVGLRFAPLKCFAMASIPMQVLSIKGIPIGQKEEFCYLGTMITPKGIDMTSSLKPRIQAARTTANWLRTKGMNGKGWRPATSLAMYRTFVQPLFEYGLALKTLDKTELAPIQQVQNFALRSIFSVARSTSIAALHRLLCLPPMGYRNKELQARYFSKLHNDTTSNNPASRVYWNLKQSAPDPRSLVWNLTRKNDIFPKGNLINRVMRIFGHRLDKEAFPSGLLRQLRFSAIENTATNQTNVGGVIPVLSSLQHSPLVTRNDIDRTTQRALILWRLGRIAYHQPCRCGEEASRIHALECSGAAEYLLNYLPVLINPRYAHLNLLDAAINSHTFKAQHDRTTAHLATAIGIVLHRCFGIRWRNRTVAPRREPANGGVT